jgi:hypothetical protein
MPLTRKDFFKKACLTGACFCGFSSLAFSASDSTGPFAPTEEEDKRLTLVQEYLGRLLLNMQENLTNEENRKTIKQLACVHYAQLNMVEFLKPYNNNLEGFIGFIEKEWGWKMTYDKSTQIIIADENKNNCVCPMINHKTGIKPGALCYCSEGFSELMFTNVIGKPVTASVISSIHRGDKSCKYKIEWINR